jgi:transposase
MSKYTYFVGIDVSKQHLDYAVVQDGKVLANQRGYNTAKGILKAIKGLQKQVKGLTIANTLFCLEHTGIYTYPLLYALKKEGASIWLEQAIQIQRSLGAQRGKNDVVDARRIALYAYKNRQVARLWVPRREVVEEIKELLTLRERCLNNLSRLKKPIKELKSHGNPRIAKLIEDSCQGAIEGARRDLASIEAKIDHLFKEDAELSRLYKLISSVDGVGKYIGAQVIVETNELDNITEGKKYACYSGVAPFEHSSGSSVRSRSRVSHRANKGSKTLFHMAALSAIRISGEFKDYYQRKVAEGKNKMSVINAIRNKIVLRVFACVRNNKVYQKNYAHPLA